MSMCVHQGHLINQGIHWCELQKAEYPDCCQNCPEFEAVPEGVVTSTATSVTNIENILNIEDILDFLGQTMLR